jgi:mRNA interferase RelE/StbE
MNVEFLKKFSKDLNDVKSKQIKLALINLIELMETLDTLDKIPHTKKLRGYKSAYRTRIGEYRLGFFFENSTIILARFLHRKDIYNIFP